VVVGAMRPPPLLEGDGGVEHLDVPLVGVLHAHTIGPLGAPVQRPKDPFRKAT
jgi:hypothetical protein